MLPPPTSLLRPLDFPRKLLMGPGPSNAPPRVLAAGALPLLGHLHPEFTKIMDEVKAGIQYIFQTKNRLTFAVSGTGHAAMEAAVSNAIERDEVVLVGVNGLWGERFSDMADRHGANVKQIKKNFGEVFSLSEVEQGLKTHQPKVMFLTHGESSGSTLQPLEGIGQLCHRYGCILVVDSVAAAGGVPLYMDDWGIDVLYSGAQKVLGAPPGASPMSFSERAWQKIQSRKTRIPSFYFDVSWLGNYWGCDGEARKYHHTAAISSVYGLREGLALLVEESLEECWKRHAECASLLYSGLAEIGLELLVQNQAHRLPTVTAILVPSDIDWKKVIVYAMDQYKVEISGGLGSLAGKIWRVGLMGYNARPENVRLVLRALKEGMQQQRNSVSSKL